MSRRKVSAAKRSAPTILIVDDHPDQREMYATYFAAHGFRTLTAPDGATADLLAEVRTIRAPARARRRAS